MDGVQSETEACKVLGAYIGREERVSERLLHKLEKHGTIFRRLKNMGANNISLHLLSRCVNVRHGYHTRVHGPDATEQLTEKFDEAVNDVLQSWFGKLSANQIAWVCLPVKLGGARANFFFFFFLGLTPTVPILEAAYRNSKRS